MTNNKSIQTNFICGDFNGGENTHRRIDYSDDRAKKMFWTEKVKDGGIEAQKLLFSPAGYEQQDFTKVVITEGETACLALHNMGISALGTVGSNIIPQDTVWVSLFDKWPHLKTIYLWPDNDAVGINHMCQVGRTLWEAFCSTHDLAELECYWVFPVGEKKGDAADIDAAARLKAISSAIPYLPPSHSTTFEFLTSRLTKDSPHSTNYHCPAHNDNTASLSVNEGDQQPIIMSCHSSICTYEDILEALRLRGLWPNKLSFKTTNKSLTPNTPLPSPPKLTLISSDPQQPTENDNLTCKLSDIDNLRDSILANATYPSDAYISPPELSSTKLDLLLFEGPSIGEGIVQNATDCLEAIAENSSALSLYAIPSKLIEIPDRIVQCSQAHLRNGMVRPKFIERKLQWKCLAAHVCRHVRLREVKNKLTEELEPTHVPLEGFKSDLIDHLIDRGAMTLIYEHQLTEIHPALSIPAPYINFPTRQIVSKPRGFDTEAKMLHAYRFDQFMIPSDLTEESIQLSKEYIESCFSGFNFRDKVNAGTFYTSLLCAVARDSMGLSPFFVIRSDEGGAGKSHLSSIMAKIRGGGQHIVTPPERPDNEVKWSIGPGFAKGAKTIIFENFNNQAIESNTVSMLLTDQSGTVHLRIPQGGSTLNDPLALYVSNGVKIEVFADHARRSIVVELVSPPNHNSREHPWDFNEVFLGKSTDAHQRRLALRIACQNILLGFVNATQEQLFKARSSISKLAGYDEWNKYIVAAGYWVGWGDANNGNKLAVKMSEKNQVDDVLQLIFAIQIEDYDNSFWPGVRMIERLLSLGSVFQESILEIGLATYLSEHKRPFLIKQLSNKSSFQYKLRKVGIKRYGQKTHNSWIVQKI